MASNTVWTGTIGIMITATIIALAPHKAIHAQHVVSDRPAYTFQRVTVDLDNAPLAAAIQLIAREAGLSPVYKESLLPPQRRVTVHARDMLVRDVFGQALRGTGLVADVHTTGVVAIMRTGDAEAASGTITGRVIDAKTQRPLRGATVLLDDALQGVQTADDGVFRLERVNSGTHRLTVRMVGYVKYVTTTNVTDDRPVHIDVALTQSVNTLDQVVVTGTIIPTELKAVPNAITVITAKQIEERGITRIDQLFRGDVPGVFAQNIGSDALLDEVTMFSRGATALSEVSAGTQIGTNRMKTYLDGVELTDFKYLSQIDPKSVERIEILTGPQASTIYGSNAINGVMQIFTKRGTSNTPQLTLNLLSGWVENNFSSARTPQHDYSAQLNGVEGRLSYNAGTSWNYMGPWTPAKQLTRTSGFGGTRLDFFTRAGRVTADVTFRRSVTQSLQRGNFQQLVTGYREGGWYTNISASGLVTPTTRILTGQTLGITLAYAPTAWWSHEANIGQDASDVETRRAPRGYSSVGDTTLSFEQSYSDRRTERYVTTMRWAFAAPSQLMVTIGADAWQNLIWGLTVSPQALTGTLTGSTTVGRQPDHNAGGFLQGQLGLQDRVFLTYGLRAEWNPAFGKTAQPNYAPRYGATYTQDFGTPLGVLTTKIRGSYGRSTRPPKSTLKQAQTIADYWGATWGSFLAPYYLPYYGSVFDLYFANPDLGPEHQQGGEGGLELYFGARGSLVVTHYNQTVDGLIDAAGIDSVRTLVACPSSSCAADNVDAYGYGYARQYQYLNIGSIRNQGWELEGSMNMGPFTTKGTYSWTKSRVIGITPRYRAYFTPSSYPQYQPGATFRFLPEHTWAFGTTYARSTSSISVNMTGVGRATNFNNSFFFQHLNSTIRLPQNRFNVSNFGNYVNANSAYALADLTVLHQFARRIEGVLYVQNLANRYTNDLYAAYASLGRQTKLGFRLHTP